MGTPTQGGPPPMEMGRRSFFAGLLGVSGAAVAALLSFPVLRYVLYPLTTKARLPAWSSLGAVSDYGANAPPVRKTVTFSQQDGWRQLESEESVYVKAAAGGRCEVLSAICPHLGCTVSWQPGPGRFACPCHGSEFAADGQLLKGPAPRGLDRLPTRVANGELEVQFEYFRPNVPNQESTS